MVENYKCVLRLTCQGQKESAGQTCITLMSGVIFLTQPPTLLPLGEVFEAVGGAALGLLVLLDVPRQLGGDVGDKEAAGPQTVVVAPHSELAVLQNKHFHKSNVAM